MLNVVTPKWEQIEWDLLPTTCVMILHAIESEATVFLDTETGDILLRHYNWNGKRALLKLRK
jgi:hypothetical protein